MDTTRQMKVAKPYTSLDEYVPFRSLDTGAPFVEAIMLFGMGVMLTAEDDRLLEDVVAPAYTALGLANDYFSFDREFAEYERATDPQPMTNAVWLCMRWYDVDVLEAKEIVRLETQKYEDQFDARKKAFLLHETQPERLRKCLDGLSQMIVGNVVWSLACPRYHPETRYDVNAGVENQFLAAKLMPTVEELRAACLTTSNEIDTHQDETPSGCQYTLQVENTIRVSRPGSQSSQSERTAAEEVGQLFQGNNAEHHAKTSDTNTANTLSDDLVLAPFQYYTSGSSKNVRTSLVDAFSLWLGTPVTVVEHVKSISSYLHNASLLLDDIEDSSELRRGRPVAHIIFGVAQTVNSANYAIIETIRKTDTLGGAYTQVLLSSLGKLSVGQSYDIHWAHRGECPSIEEYIRMIDGKTGELFHLLAKLLLCGAQSPRTNSDGYDQSMLKHLITTLGRLFQIRDDHRNLTDVEYTGKKGFCEDLDEGKYSYPVIVAINSGGSHILKHILKGRRARGERTCMPHEMKTFALEQIQACGALAETEKVLSRLHDEVQTQLQRVEALFGEKNWILRLIIHKLMG